MNKKTGQVILGCALALAFALPLARTARADDECHRRLEADRARIDREAAKHGNNSPEVGRAVDKMEADKQWCRDHHADWDHDRFDVGIYVHPH